MQFVNQQKEWIPLTTVFPWIWSLRVLWGRSVPLVLVASHSPRRLAVGLMLHIHAPSVTLCATKFRTFQLKRSLPQFQAIISVARLYLCVLRSLRPALVCGHLGRAPVRPGPRTLFFFVGVSVHWVPHPWTQLRVRVTRSRRGWGWAAEASSVAQRAARSAQRFDRDRCLAATCVFPPPIFAANLKSIFRYRVLYPSSLSQAERGTWHLTWVNRAWSLMALASHYLWTIDGKSLSLLQAVVL